MPTTTGESATTATLLLRLVLSSGAASHEVLVTATTDTTWRELRAHLREHVPLPEQVYAGAAAVTEDAVFGSTVLRHGAVLSDRPRPDRSPALLEVATAEGPDAGTTHPLGTSAVLIGRAAPGGVAVADPDLSRRHLLLEIAHGHVQATDLGSTNGTRVDGDALVPGAATEVRVAQRITAGGSTFRLQPPVRHTHVEAVAGRVAVHRAPRDPVRLPTVELTLPQPPADHRRDRLPWLMVLLPIPVALVMAVAMKSMMMLGFGLMSPVMMLGQYLHDRRSGRADHRREQAEYERDREVTAQRSDDAVAEAVALRRRLAPDLAELRATTARQRVWPRRPTDADHLWWRVGTGEVEVGVVEHDPGHETRERTASACPVVVPLDRHRVVGLCGPQPLRRRAATALVGQICALHSPLYVRLVVVVASTGDLARWRWARALDHLSSGAGPLVLVAGIDDELIAASLSHLAVAPEERLRTTERDHVRTVVVLDGARRLATHSTLSGVLTHGASHGAAVVAVDDAHTDLPPACEVTVEISAPGRGQVRGEIDQAFRPDLPGAGWELAVAADLIALVDATPSESDAEPPSAARLLDLTPDITSPDALAAGWSSGSGRTTRALLGLSGEGRVVVDLAVDGPHALIAGTTGSGKSELLQTLIASLAVGNRPDEMVFVLVDYKGGAAFKDCARLPHTVGLVTDLDAHLTQRALASLDAEVHRRERLLGAVGAKDLEDYQRISDAEPLPRLVLVIDEFRVLAEELPDFIDGLVRIAAVGRSLGIHLVLATQRPAGVVSTDIRANVNLRIALRVRDSGDSDDVIESTAAASISTATPGRAIMRSASSPLVTFQAARVGGHALDAAGAVEVRPVDPVSGRPAALDATADEPDGPTDLQRLVDAALHAADRCGVTRVASPWLPQLPAACSVADLGGSHRLVDAPDEDGVPARDGQARLGLVDLPHLQRQDALAWSLASGHLAVIGGPRSGRTTAARTITCDLASATSADDLHVYVIDSSGSLGGLAALPHVGAVVGRDDEGACVRLITWLVEEIACRQSVLATEQHTDIDEHRASRTAAGRQALPRLLVVVDGWDAFTETYEMVEAGRVVDDVQQVLRDGVGVGVHVLVTGGRSLLSSRVAGFLQHRLVLRMADEMDLMMAGLRPQQVPVEMPPGRALLLPDAHEVQLALLDTDPSGRAQAAAVARVVDRCAPSTAQPPRRFASLPDEVSITGLTAQPGELVVGVSGDDLTAATITPDPAWGLAVLVCGPSGSGRTTTLETLVHGLDDPGRVLWLSGGAPPESLPAGATHLPWDDTQAVWQHLEQHPGTVLVLDDLERIAHDHVHEMAVEHLRLIRTSGGALLAAGTTSDMTGAFRGVAHELRRRQCGIVLQPDRHDSEVFGTRLPDVRRRVPGRGVLVRRGRAVEVQVARADRNADHALPRQYEQAY
ncbi:FtsK/SpoIIIE domain-containing protein [Luteipulveratus halotolerans]|uniref:FtsK/SpoIIIE domain-containing protein n=1 Tax=Luteipulveratus halotolerans TaxID=1631356 RepID=UPI0009E4CB98|nr:FtsK/SpoIIIE domain-containing protein [Luteipulveratus halotolerans]